MVDAPKTLQDVAWRAGMHSGLAVPWVSPRLAPVAAEQWEVGAHRRTGSHVPLTARGPSCLPHSRSPKIISLNPSREGRGGLVLSGWGTQAGGEGHLLGGSVPSLLPFNETIPAAGEP